DDDFEVRQGATARLGALGRSVAPLLHEALSHTRSPEVRARLRQLLGTARRAWSPGELRDLRAVEGLEVVGSREARTLLGARAAGSPAGVRTQEARAALRRLPESERRPVPSKGDAR